MRANATTMPLRPNCGALARPNVMMFGDYGFVSQRLDGQQNNLDEFLDSFVEKKKSGVVVELGAGEFVPTVRRFGEGVVRGGLSGVLVRINPRDSHVLSAATPPWAFSLPLGAKDALEKIDACSTILPKRIK